MAKGMMKVLAVSLLLVGASSAMANAGLVGDLIHINVCDADGLCVGQWFETTDKAEWIEEENAWLWQLESDQQITSMMDPENVLAEVLVQDPEAPDNTTWVKFMPPVEGLRSDPRVDLNFVVRAGTTYTEFTITSSLLTFPTIPNAEGKASVSASVTDRHDDTATLGSLSGFDAVSYSYVNGLPDTGTEFTRLLSDPIVTPPGGTNTGSDSTPPGWTPVGTDVSSMSAQLKFGLTARDLASGSSAFVIPEPGSLLLLVGMALVARRR